MPSGFTLEADFIGTLAQILSGLRGYDTLAFELIQNADDAEGTKDAPAATTISFDVTDQAVEVWNDGEFTWCGAREQSCSQDPRCDLHAFLRVASETKRGRDETTGAFGVGFTAVYQLTDRPELITPRVHLTLQPELADPSARVLVCEGCDACAAATGTTFRLPWAATVSELRTRLGVEPCRDPERFVADLERGLFLALPFLRRVESITLLRDGQHVAGFSRERHHDHVILAGPTGQVRLERLYGEFADEADEFREADGTPIEEKRRHKVEVLVGAVDVGRLYAGLPTQQTVPARMLIDGNFYPHSSRKIIKLENDVRSSWNRAALRAAANAVADQLDSLPRRIGTDHTWALMRSIDATTRSETDAVFAEFWPVVAEAAKDAAILPTPDGALVAPQDAVFVPAEDDDHALAMLARLGFSVADPLVRGHLSNVRRSDLGLRDLSPAILSDTLESQELEDLTRLDRSALWRLLNGMLARLRGTKAYDTARAVVAETATAPEIDGEFLTWDGLSAADTQTTELFREECYILNRDAIDGFVELETLASPFGVDDAIRGLRDAQPDAIEGRALAFVQWFIDRQARIRGSDDVFAQIAELPIFPFRRGDGPREFGPLEQITLPADRRGSAFRDPIGIARTLDLDAGQQLRLFAETCGIETLSIGTYVERTVLPALAEVSETPAWLDQVLVLLAEHVDDLAQHRYLLDELREHDIIPCQDGERRPAAEVYLPTTEVVEVLGASVPVAAVPTDPVALLDLLGVRREPAADDVVERVRLTTARRPTDERVEIIHRVLRHLASHAPAGDTGVAATAARIRMQSAFGELTSMRWLPAAGDCTEWHRSDGLFRDNERHLFHTQARFLDVPTSLRDQARAALENLGVQVRAPLELVVSHLLRCRTDDTSPHPEVYRRLNLNLEREDELDPLRDAECLYLADGVWASPRDVFWEDHGLTPYAHKLDPTDWEEWRPLLTALGVRSTPETTDAIRVLRRVGEDLTDSLEDSEQQLVLRCWQIVEGALAAGAIDAAHVNAQLGNARCVVDCERQLTRPPELFVDDSPELGRRFANALGPALIPKPPGVWEALRAAGVRGLRDTTRPDIDHRDSRSFSVLRKHLTDRHTQIARLVEHGVGSAGLRAALDRMRSLQLVAARDLTVSWIFEPDPRVRTSRRNAVAVADRGNRLYVDADLSDPEVWIDLARELALVIAPDSGGLGLLKDVLAVDEPETADRLLDRLDIPRLSAEIVSATKDEAVGRGEMVDDAAMPETETTAEPTADEERAAVPAAKELPAGEDGGDPSPTNGDGERNDASKHDQTHRGGERDPEDTRSRTPGRERDGQGETGDGRTVSRGAGRTAGNRPPSRKDAHDWWYAIVSGRSTPTEDRSLGANEQQRARRRKEIDAAGMAAVTKYEERAGRHPNPLGGNNEGFDIESCNAAGDVLRYIEVKSLTGSWGDGGFPRLTVAQWDFARDSRDEYWVYVVEHAESGSPQVTRIQDPVTAASRYVLDPGWRHRGEPEAAAADEDDSAEDLDLDLVSDAVRELCEALIAEGRAPSGTLVPVGEAGVVIEAAWAHELVALVSAESTAVVDGWRIVHADQVTPEQLLNLLGVEVES